MRWEVMLLDEVEKWFLDLAEHEPDTADQIAAALDLLEEQGPTLGRPLVDRLKGSTRHNMKELRPGSSGSSEVRMLFVFDPYRQAIMLTAGDKAGAWSDWYDENIPLAEERYGKWLKREKKRREPG